MVVGVDDEWPVASGSARTCVVLGDLGISCGWGHRAGELQASSLFPPQRNLDGECFSALLCHQLHSFPLRPVCPSWKPVLRVQGGRTLLLLHRIVYGDIIWNQGGLLCSPLY